jgi:hypothetical protein
MWEAMNDCMIIHNMIIESERAFLVIDDQPYDPQGPLSQVDHEVRTVFHTFLQVHAEIRYKHVHARYKVDLVEHIWVRKGGAG